MTCVFDVHDPRLACIHCSTWCLPMKLYPLPASSFLFLWEGGIIIIVITMTKTPGRESDGAGSIPLAHLRAAAVTRHMNITSPLSLWLGVYVRKACDGCACHTHTHTHTPSLPARLTVACLTFLPSFLPSFPSFRHRHGTFWWRTFSASASE